VEESNFKSNGMKTKGQKYREMAERGMLKQKELAEKAKQRLLEKQG